MTSRAQVKCIRKRGSHYDPHERIEGIGGYVDKAWYLPENDAIRMIETREWDFFVSVNYKEVAVVVASHNGRKYLKTVADGYAPNNLLSLPECPR